MNRVIFLFLIVFSNVVLADSTIWKNSQSEALSACTAFISSGSCAAGSTQFNQTQCVGGQVGSYSGYNGGQNSTNTYKYCINGNNCPSGQVLNSSGVCVCPSGQIYYQGACITQPPNCTTSEINQVCGSTVCTGTYSPSVNCWLPAAQAPSGCESGTKTNSGCPANCLGGQTENPVTHACEDPVCVGGQTLDANHYCQDPTCIGGQTFNSANHSCDEPVCGTGYSVNTSSHVCEFSGCPTNTNFGTINGTVACIPSGETTAGTADTTETTTTEETSQTTTNQDGTQTTTTTGTTSTTGSTDIKLDTKGLAQESTMNKVSENTKGILDKLNEINTAPFSGGSGFTDLYSNTDPNSYSGIFSSFSTRLQASQIGGVATGLFDVQLAGSCPVWVFPSTALTPSLTIDQFCSSALTDVWPFIQAVMLAVATALAIRVAFF